MKTTKPMKLGLQGLEALQKSYRLLIEAAKLAQEEGDMALAESFKDFANNVGSIISHDNGDAGLDAMLRKL